MTKRCTMLLALLAFTWPLASWSGSLFPDDYDRDFKDAAIFLPAGTDWRLLKAQCYQESRLNPHAVSPAGAVGLCQFMPATWRDMQDRHGFTNMWLPEQSIRAAAVYMNTLHKGWSSPRPSADRYALALASYNAGFGNILKAQKRCDMAALYADITPCLEQVTGYHAKETTGYVRNIVAKWFPMMVLGG